MSRKPKDTLLVEKKYLLSKAVTVEHMEKEVRMVSVEDIENAPSVKVKEILARSMIAMADHLMELIAEEEDDE